MRDEGPFHPSSLIPHPFESAGCNRRRLCATKDNDPRAPGGLLEARHMKKGVPVSPGVAVARAYCVDEVLARREPLQLDEAALSGEISRFDSACAAAVEELDAIVTRVSQQLGEDEAAIFRAHRLLLRDPAFIGKVKSLILKRHVDASSALHETLEEYTQLFERIEDEYLRERMIDLRDVV